MNKKHFIVAAMLVIAASIAAWVAFRATRAGSTDPSLGERILTHDNSNRSRSASGSSGFDGTEGMRTDFADILGRAPNRVPEGENDGGVEVEKLVTVGSATEDEATPASDRTAGNIPDIAGYSSGFFVEKVPGSNPDEDPPLTFANRGDEIDYYQRLIGVFDEKVFHYREAVTEFQKNGDKESEQYYLGKLTEALNEKAQHDASLRQAVQRME